MAKTKKTTVRHKPPDGMTRSEKVEYAEARGWEYNALHNEFIEHRVEEIPVDPVDPNTTNPPTIDGEKYNRDIPQTASKRGTEMLSQLREYERGSVLTTPGEGQPMEADEEFDDREDLIERLMQRNAWPRDYAEKMADKELARREKTLLTR